MFGMISELWISCDKTTNLLHCFVSSISPWVSAIFVASRILMIFQKSFNVFFLLNIMLLSILLDSKEQDISMASISWPLRIVRSSFIILYCVFAGSDQMVELFQHLPWATHICSGAAMRWTMSSMNQAKFSLKKSNIEFWIKPKFSKMQCNTIPFSWLIVQVFVL